jgi:hypothetical protein
MAQGKDTAQVKYTTAARIILGGGPPLPAGCPKDNPPDTRAELEACLKVLQFSTIEALGDKQRLMTNPPCRKIGDPCRYGPLATIQPEVHSHLYTDEEIGHGRIIALMFLDPGEKKEYEKLGLSPKGKTYWWVLRTSDDSLPRGSRSVFVTLDSLGKVDTLEDRVRLPLRYTNHEYEGGFTQAVARWIWDPEDEVPQGHCGQGCCK